MSYVLRHSPDSIGITLDKQGWTDLELLIEKLDITRDELEYVVVNNSKKRFSISENAQRIRANQGHSVDIELGLKEKKPPKVLYHGTAISNLEKINEAGLLKMNRNHVHLSSDIETAKQVGSRHGKPVVLVISCEEMLADNIKFYQSDNGVWLTDFVDSKYIAEI